MTPIRVLLLLATISFTAQSIAQPKFTKVLPPEFSGNLTFDTGALCKVAGNTLDYINRHENDRYAVHGGEMLNNNISLERVKRTLAFICKTAQEDLVTGRVARLTDPRFLKENFEFVHWLPDKEKANTVAKKSTNQVKRRLLSNIPEQQIFLTKYYTKLLKGSEQQTPKYTQALYALPFDEQGVSIEEASKRQSSLTRYRYTRQQVIQGALLKNNLAKPLVWISEEALHDVLLQGTGVLEVNGQTRYFNVHRNNGIAYDYHIGKREQARYWYFAEVPSIMGYGQKIDEKIALAPHVSVAGNIKQLGLGKLFLLQYQTNGADVSRLAILADEGGAFDDNLFQLDLLVDSYYGWKDYHQANKHLSDYASAWIMVLKQ
ncbi:MltA domain-containing protein [Thalassotalea atypica]|uniref:MltA domain-containing protein n=1 Tax=Thalassotalea atypica TaxID=2054316 RepID=UPI0025736B51|nr:MltA domain-containing protein [Thalassotalea atypica]